MYRIISVVLVLMLLTACDKQEKEQETNGSPRVKKQTSVVKPKMNAEVKMGETVQVEVSAGESTVDSVQVIVKGKSETFIGAKFTWQPEANRVGTFNFQLKVYSGGKEETHYPRLRVLSDTLPEQYTAMVMGTYDHDTEAYTQGLFYYDNHLYESTGEKGKSTLRKVHPVTGDVLDITPMAEEYFGEGCTYHNGRIFQLTWQSRVGIIYDMELNQTGTFAYATEGWGLTTMGDTLVMSDGSEKLYFINPQGFTPIDQIEVYDHKGPVNQLNELEYVNGMIYANRYQTDDIYVIDPATGRVVQKIDLSGLLAPAEAAKADVLNGIAYDAEGDRLFVTGKWWPWLFEIKLQPKNNTPI